MKTEVDFSGEDMSGKLFYKKIPFRGIDNTIAKKWLQGSWRTYQKEQRNIFATFSYLSKKRENIADLTQEALMRMARGLINLKIQKLSGVGLIK